MILKNEFICVENAKVRQLRLNGRRTRNYLILYDLFSVQFGTYETRMQVGRTFRPEKLLVEIDYASKPMYF